MGDPNFTLTEQDNYPWTKLNGQYYYIPDPKKALSMGTFMTEDTKDIYLVTGIDSTTGPNTLLFDREPWGRLSDDMSAADFPLAKRVKINGHDITI